MTEDLLFDGSPFRARDAAKAGLPYHELQARLRGGEVRRLVRGVYADRRAPLTTPLRARAAALVAPPGAVAVLGTAAWIFGVPPVEPGSHEQDRNLEFAVPRGRAGMRLRGCRGLVRLLPPAHLQDLGDLVVTDPVLTCLELARDRARPDALAYVDALLHARLTTRDALLDHLPLVDGLRWAEQAREIVDLSDARAESPGESWLRLRHLDAGFPRPELQLWVGDEDRPFRYRLDMALPGCRLAEEYDGEDAHGREHEAHDTRRQRWLEGQGWRHLRFGKGEVLGRGYAFELAVGEVLGREPRLLRWEARLRTFAQRRRPTTSA